MAVAQVQVPKNTGGGFFDILGSVLKLGSAVGSLYASGGAMLPAEAPGIAAAAGTLAGVGAGAGEAVKTGVTVGQGLEAMKRASDLGGSAISAAEATKSLVAPGGQGSVQVQQTKTTKPSALEGITNPSVQLMEARQLAMSNPGLISESEMARLDKASALAQRQDYLKMRRGGY